MVHKIYHHQRTRMRTGSYLGRNNKIAKTFGRRTNEKSIYESVRIYLRRQSQGLSHMEQKISNLNEKCLTLMKENTELSNKLKKVDEVTKKTKQLSENEKNLNKMLFNARRVIKEKEK